MVGEKYLNPDSYLDGTDWADNESMYSGEDNDTNRTTYCPVPLPADYVPDHTPMQDTPGMMNIYAFRQRPRRELQHVPLRRLGSGDQLHDRPRDPSPAGQSRRTACRSTPNKF